MSNDRFAERYARAERFLEPSIHRLVRGARPAPHWMAGGDGAPVAVDAFWYERQAAGGARQVLVEPFAGRASEGFDPPSPAQVPGTALRSPDGRYDLIRTGHDLTVVEVASGARRPLTTGGAPDLGYGVSPASSLTSVTAARTGEHQPPVAIWSPDSTRVLTHLLDERSVPELPLVQHVPADGWRPRLWNARVPFVGDALAGAQLVALDVESGARQPLGEPLHVQFFSPLELGWVWWDASGETVWLLREERGARALHLERVDAQSGSVTRVLSEAGSEYVEPSAILPWTNWTQVHLDEVCWLSERDGWAHIYVHDAHTGKLRRQLTSGDWCVLEIRRIDAEGYVYFVASGREPASDPYDRVLYRVPLTGGTIDRLTPESADHTVTFAPSGACFVDTFSRPDRAPVTRVRASDGRLLIELETADLSGLTGSGWVAPERIRVTAGDGATELFGTLFFPSDFDPSVKYPLIDSLYPGPQLIRSPTSFAVESTDPHEWPSMWDAQALAELGAIVMTLDGRGTPLRSKAFHHFSYGRLQAGGELDDHVSAIAQLAAKRPYLDTTRVGVIGHSAGGYAAVRAMLLHPETFTVGVASSGPHDLRGYLAYWGEKYQGPPDDPSYGAQSNAALAERLAGRLLLIHGDLDDNVHPASTLRLVSALIAANRDFDLLIMPNQNHECYRDPYYIRRVWDHFVRHLLGATPPVGYRIGAGH